MKRETKRNYTSDRNKEGRINNKRKVGRKKEIKKR